MTQSEKIFSLGLKRSAAVPKSAKSTKSQAKKKPVLKDAAPGPIAAAASPADAAGDFDIDAVIAFLKKAIQIQMKAIQEKPSKDAKTANLRTRDSRALGELVRSMERIEALEKRREKKGRKKPKSDAELKERFVRRLDQLLAARGKGSVPEGAEPG